MEIKLKIETLNGVSLVNDNLVNVINSGIVTMQRTNEVDQRVSIRDIGSELIEVTIKVDAINLSKLLACAQTL